MQSPDRTLEATGSTEAENSISRSAWHNWDSPVGLGILLVSLGIALVSTGAALVLVRRAFLGA